MLQYIRLGNPGQKLLLYGFINAKRENDNSNIKN